MIIAIDGPAGAGKSTVARELSKRLNYKYLDTGAMYRAITFELINRKLEDSEDLEKVFKEIIDSIELDFVDGDIVLNGRILTKEIREPIIDKHVSKAASSKVVRSFLSSEQRKLAINSPNTILEGRDTTTVVCPDAQVKIFLTASLDERARRRYKELLKKDIKIDFEEVKRQIEKRDKSDTTREIGPLKVAEDAVVIDSTEKDVEWVVDKIFSLVRNKRKQLEYN
ncbi:Cytidylate kinase [Thermodesulfobium narugense DSM 14796]|uniref:Cytidylate kinase n=1 Tax=Thermodesulfobium narugense DSM 14796 TaxID=747365 RepID=M1E4Q3_9BACT|nr:(d)CMP kinase [Thermodesulfobium narugense]AEE14402.1 Cytidylate kinase [Thermodesulfobium narugense DSM 14796]